jgi:ATP-dependent exoDNAse (exonuclease V) alpha subunit
MEGSLQTIHNLLEYSPVVVWSEKQEREVKIFKPQRGEWDPLQLTHLVIEEASMLGLDLWDELRPALLAGVQLIYVGDINQLPPVFGKSVMSYALTKLPIVHLDMVYRQALDNPIIAAAHSVLHGKPFTESRPALKWIQGKSKIVQPEEAMSRAMGRLFELGLENKKRISDWRKELADYAVLPIEARATAPKPKTEEAIAAEEKKHVIYNPEEDIVLIPFNKNAMGTKQINYRIAQHLGEERKAEVFEIIAGFEKHYLAVGDKVMVNKMEGVITNISANMNYMGRKPMTPSVNLSRFGFYLGTTANKDNGDDDFGLEELDIDVEHTIEEEEERKQQSSHVVTCELETGQTASISSAGEFNQQIFQLGYALSIHKAQGSEWRRVFLLFHKNHSTMLSRELLYTAMTRAREELVIVARPELITKAIKSPRIKGNSLAEKIEYFNSGYLDEDIEVTV